MATGATAQPVSDWQTVQHDPGDWQTASQKEVPKSWLDQATSYASGVWDNLKQSGQGMVNAATTNPLTTLKNIGAAHAQTEQKAEDAFKRGDYTEGVRHVIDYLLPIIGPQIDAQGDEAQHGQLAHALGGATSLGLQIAAPGALEHPAVAQGVDTAATATKAAVPAAIKASVTPATYYGAWGPEIAADMIGLPRGTGVAMVAIPRIIKAGMAAGKQALQAGVPEEVADNVAMLEGLAQSQLGKSFARATEEEKASIRTLADRINGAPVPSTAPAPMAQSSPVPSPGVQSPPVPSLTIQQRLDAELAARRGGQAAPPGGGNAAPGAVIGGQPSPIGANVPLRPPLAPPAAPVAVQPPIAPTPAPAAPAPSFSLPQATQALANRLSPSVRPPVPLTPEAAATNTVPQFTEPYLEKAGTSLNWETGGKSLPPQALTDRANIAETAAQAMYKSGITSDMLQHAEGTPLYESVKAGLAKIPGISKQGKSYAALSDDTMDIARDRLAQLEKAGPAAEPAAKGNLPAALANNPKAAAIAKKLAAEMSIGDLMQGK